MIYTAPNREQLPTIGQVMTMVRDLMSQMPIRHRMPYDEPVEGDDLFLLNRTASGLFTLKPNITMQPCLFYGDNDYHRIKRTTWSALDKNSLIVDNVLREELEVTMRSHPLYQLFRNGIPTRRNPVRIRNPFGIATAYGFPSPMISFSSSLDVAAFFATHRQNAQTGQWTAIPERNEHGEINVGVLYMLELAMPFPMMLGLSVIGMQAFQRPGAQRLFALNLTDEGNLNSHRFVTGFQFRQHPEDIAEIARDFQNGDLLTPDELIAHKANDILSTKRVSEVAFAVNCGNNPHQDYAANRRKLEEAGIEIVEDAGHLYSEDELNREFYPTAVERWEEMFGHVVAVHPGFDELLDDILDFPNTPTGHEFFRR